MFIILKCSKCQVKHEVMMFGPKETLRRVKRDWNGSCIKCDLKKGGVKNADNKKSKFEILTKEGARLPYTEEKIKKVMIRGAIDQIIELIEIDQPEACSVEAADVDYEELLEEEGYEVVYADERDHITTSIPAIQREADDEIKKRVRTFLEGYAKLLLELKHGSRK